MTIASTLAATRSDRSLSTAQRVARLMGWGAIAFGLAEMIAPRRLGRAVGLEGKEGLLRAYGGREIGSGVWALSDTPAPAMWGRVAGDLLDLGTLVVGLGDADETQRRNAFITLAGVAGVTLVDLLTAASLTAERSERRGEAGRDYSDRSGFPGGIRKARGVAEGAAPGDVPVGATPGRAARELETA